MNHQLRDIPNFHYLINDEDGGKDVCAGFKGSTCLIEMTLYSYSKHFDVSQQKKVQLSCRFECSYTRSWVASLDDPMECHFLSRDMLSPVTRGLGKIPFVHIRRVKNTKAKRLSQSELDPHQWPIKFKGSINIFTSSDGMSTTYSTWSELIHFLMAPLLHFYL